MSISTLEVLGISAGALNGLSFVPYVRSILQGKSKPERSSWWIWSILMVVALAAQVAAGATWSLFLTGTFLVGNLVVAVLSLRYGYGHLKPIDFMAIILTGFGICLWQATKNPLIGLVLVIAADFMGGLLTMQKTWRAPYSENLPTWILSTAAAILAVLSVGSLVAAKLIFPIYVIFCNGALVLIIIQRRNWRKQRARAGRNAVRPHKRAGSKA